MVRKGMSVETARKLRLAKGIKDTRLEKYRIKKGLSQADLSRASGVTKRSIQCYEQGERVIDNAKLETLCDLASNLDVKISDILEDERLIEKYNKVK